MILLLAACGEDPVMLGDCLVSEDSSGLPSQAWMDWAEEQVEEQRAGSCARFAPTEARTESGCSYEPDVVIATGGQVDLNIQRWPGSDEGELLVSLGYGPNYVVDGCLGRHSDDPSELQLKAGGTVTEEEEPIPGAWILGDGGGPNGWAWDGSWSQAATGWLCVDTYSGASTQSEAAAAASGSMYLHVEHWDDPDQVPADYFFTFDRNDCAGAEDASGRPAPYTDHWEDGYFWPAYCDGIDNDLDGEIDEYGVDADGNGISDCRECEAWEWSDGCPAR